MSWTRLGTYIRALDEAPELYDLTGRWVELLQDPPDPKPYDQVEISADVTPGTSYWYVTEDITDITVSRLSLTPSGCRYEPWLTVPKAVFVPRRQTAKVRQAFVSADARAESAPQFLRKRLFRAPST